MIHPIAYVSEGTDHVGSLQTELGTRQDISQPVTPQPRSLFLTLLLASNGLLKLGYSRAHANTLLEPDGDNGHKHAQSL